MTMPTAPPQRPDDRLALHGLRAHAITACSSMSGATGQEFVVDVELGLDTRAAADGDDLSATVHYGELAERLHTASAATRST